MGRCIKKLKTTDVKQQQSHEYNCKPQFNYLTMVVQYAVNEEHYLASANCHPRSSHRCAIAGKSHYEEIKM